MLTPDRTQDVIKFTRGDADTLEIVGIDCVGMLSMWRIEGIVYCTGAHSTHPGTHRAYVRHYMEARDTPGTGYSEHYGYGRDYSRDLFNGRFFGDDEVLIVHDERKANEGT